MLLARRTQHMPKSAQLSSLRRACRELLGPVTAISALDGLLVVAAGKSVEVHEWVRLRIANMRHYARLLRRARWASNGALTLAAC